MSGKQAATVGSNHTCPMCSGTMPHVGGPITQGETNVLFNGKPVATIGSMCTCVGPSDMVVQGNPSVLINGKPIVCVDMTAHGGVIVSGSSSIIIGNTSTEPPTAIMPIKKNPFPKITIINRVLGNAKEAIANQKKIKELSENNDGEPQIYNLQWIKEEKIVKASKKLKKVTLQASVNNIADGESITFRIKKSVVNTEESKDVYEEFVELSGTVQDKMVEVIWEIDITDESEEETQL